MLPDLESRCNMGVPSVISCSFDLAIDAGVLASRMNVEKCLLLNTLTWSLISFRLSSLPSGTPEVNSASH